jgi:hypothetical protein
MLSITSARFSTILALSFAFPAGSLLAQQVISARSGVVQYVEGDVTLANEILNPKAGEFPSLKKNEVLRTEQGRAEILLTPGVFLRAGENSSIRMVANSLADTQVEFLDGSALVECDDLLKDNSIAFLHNGIKVSLQKNGLYRFDSNPARVSVYNGQAVIQAAGGNTITVKGGHQAQLEGELAVTGFDGKLAEDALYRWSSRRSDYISMANVSAAKQIQDSGSAWGSNIWAFNPYFGMYTFVPFGGSMFSPFGYGFYSPFDAWNFYNAYPSYYGYGSGYGYPSGGYVSRNKGGGGSGGASGSANRTPYTSRQLGYTTATRTARSGAVGRSSVGMASGGGRMGGGESGVSSARSSGTFSAGPSSGMSSSVGRGGGASSGGGARSH